MLVREDALEIIHGRMVALGYGRYWRSDEIVGLRPIEEERGAGRRTEVFVSTSDVPIVASRSERTILRDMVRLRDEEFRAEEARHLLAELLDDLSDVTPVIRRMLGNEVGVDVRAWELRIAALVDPEQHAAPEEQEDLFSAS